MVDAEFLRDREIKSVADADPAHVLGERRMHLDVVARHLGLVVRAEGRLRDPDRKGR